MSALHESAMLVELTISQWTATRHDKAVSAEVEQQHNATNAGRYNKWLVDRSLLEPVNKAATAIRQFHYAKTLPWSDKGARLLPSRLFMEYRDGLAKLRNAFEDAANDFRMHYPQAVQQAQSRLGTMFCQDDYPDAWEIRNAFDIKTDYTPIPSANDFRLQIAGEEQDEIKASVERAVQERQAKALENCYARLRLLLERIKEQCAKDTPRIHDSLMGNLREFLDVLSAFNITNDPTLIELENAIRGTVLQNVDVLRSSSHARKDTAAATDAILKRMKR